MSYMSLRPGAPYDPVAADESLKVLFETGLFANVRINFDPANMILYGAGDPIKLIFLRAPGDVAYDPVRIEHPTLREFAFQAAWIAADVARHSVDVAHKGGEAVRRTIDGMNAIRETIQEKLYENLVKRGSTFL